MKKKTLINKYDILLSILIISLIYGRYGVLHPATILSVLYIPFLLDEISSRMPNYLKPFVLFFSFWLLYGFITLIWTPSQTWNLDYFYLFIHCLMFLEILVISKRAKSPLSTLSNAWVLAFLFTSVFALWEITTDHHLSSAREEGLVRNALGETYIKEYATFTFYNPNTYCLYIVFVFPFILYRLVKSEGLLSLFFNLIPLILSFYILFSDGSRGALLSVSIMLFFYVYFIIWKSTMKSRVYFLLSFLIILFVVIFNQSIFDYFLFRIESKSLMEDNARIILWESSLDGFLSSYGFGQGVGSMIPALHNRVNSTFIYFSHNLVFELLLEYGVLITVLFVFFLFRLLRNAFKLQDTSLKIVIMGSIFSFPFYSVINSENIRPTFTWCFIASIVVFSYYRRALVNKSL